MLIIWYIIFKYWINNPSFIGMNIPTILMVVIGIVTLSDLIKGKFMTDI